MAGFRLAGGDSTEGCGRGKLRLPAPILEGRGFCALAMGLRAARRVLACVGRAPGCRENPGELTLHNLASPGRICPPKKGPSPGNPQVREGYGGVGRLGAKPLRGPAPSGDPRAGLVAKAPAPLDPREGRRQSLECAER